MKVLGFDPFLAPAAAAQIGIETVPDLDALLPQVDFLTVHTPLTDETRDLIGARELALMREGARVINCARGGIINEEALAEALQSGHLAGAALDVFVQEPPPPIIRCSSCPTSSSRRTSAPPPSRRKPPWPSRRPSCSSTT